MVLFPKFEFIQKKSIVIDSHFYIYLIILIMTLFTIISQIYYIYVNSFNIKRCSLLNNNDKNKCVSKSDMRNFLYNKIFN